MSSGTADISTGSATAGEQELVLPRVAAGEPGAAKECLGRFGGLVWSLCRRMCATEAEAEDAVQDIFVDVWKSSERYDESIASETAFVAMIARRRLIDRRRKIGRRPKEHGLPDGGLRQGSQSRSGVGPDSAAEGAPESAPVILDEASKAAEALEQLSAAQQRVIRLSVYHGLSHEKISQATGLPLGTVKTHSRRGLIRLREILAADSSSGDERKTGAES